MKSFLAVIIAAVAAPALAAHDASTTVMVSPCPSSTASMNDIVTRTPVMMSQSTPCPTLSIVKTNGTTITMSHDGSGSDAGSTPSMSTTGASYTGAAVANNAGLSGAVAAAFGLAAFVL